MTWPLSILWGVPEAAIDANSINKRDLLMYYMYDERGRRFYQNLRWTNGRGFFCRRSLSVGKSEAADKRQLDGRRIKIQSERQP